MQGNDFIKILLYSPLQGILGGTLMLITVMGRKSGRAITTPVNYYRDGNILWVISNRDRKWWRNVRGGRMWFCACRAVICRHAPKQLWTNNLSESKLASMYGIYRCLPLQWELDFKMALPTVKTPRD